MNYLESNTHDWKDIQKTLFPSELPDRFEWTDLKSIIRVLKTISSVEDSNHMFYPNGGGMDIEGAGPSSEIGCIEIDTGGLFDILKPSRLIFHSIKNAEPQWNYFRLETQELNSIGKYDEDYSDEELCELKSGVYISSQYYYDGEYNGEKIPSEARLVTRHFRGAFVIFQKTSLYNQNSGTYDGRHNKMSDDDFRNYLQSVIDNLKTPEWND